MLFGNKLGVIQTYIIKTIKFIAYTHLVTVIRSFFVLFTLGTETYLHDHTPKIASCVNVLAYRYHIHNNELVFYEA